MAAAAPNPPSPMPIWCSARSIPTYFAGGKIALDEAGGGRSACSARSARRWALDDFWPAAGVTEIVEENMANAARVHAIERGKDIAACTMIAFGGGAPLHACRLAEKLGDRPRSSCRAAPASARPSASCSAPIAYEITQQRRVCASMPFDAGRVNAMLERYGRLMRRPSSSRRWQGKAAGGQPHRRLPLCRPGPRDPGRAAAAAPD